MTKTATVSLHDSYEADPMLTGTRVELVFDPFDLAEIEVRAAGKPTGKAVPHRLGRHTHPKASPEIPPHPAAPTWIDYLKVLDATHQANTAKGINHAPNAMGNFCFEVTLGYRRLELLPRAEGKER
ncbi:hypothetical protein ABZ358_55190, partial [Streptomyces mirabilis]